MTSRDWPEAGVLGRLWIVFTYVLGLPFFIAGLTIGWTVGAFTAGYKTGFEEAQDA